jgi:preprotein translocase subunit SecY
MLNTLVNIFRIGELRNKILFTLGMLAVYRIGIWIPLPGVNQEQLAEQFRQATEEGTAFGKVANFMSMFSGGSLVHSTVFGLGIMPYITAGIIFQLFASVSPQLKKIQEEGPSGRIKIQIWTRYVAVGLCIVQGIGWLTFINQQGLVYPQWANQPIWWVMGLAALTAGTVFLMWLGEQIDRYGIGNGVSMIIMAGILADIPRATQWIVANFAPGEDGKLGWMGVLSLIGGAVLVTGAAVLMTVAQRRIPVQQAKHTRGRRVFGGQKSYLPLKVNHSGVMPIIFASSLMIFPTIIFDTLKASADTPGQAPGTLFRVFDWMGIAFTPGEFLYCVVFVLMTYFFAYFWVTVQFSPQDMAKQLREHGSFIPGLRPGPRTAEYLETVITRITYVGATFLAVIAILPMVVQHSMNVPYHVTHFLGGTGVLIVVSVLLDFLQRIEANLLMRNYAGFLSQGDSEGPRLKGPRG